MITEASTHSFDQSIKKDKTWLSRLSDLFFQNNSSNFFILSLIGPSFIFCTLLLLAFVKSPLFFGFLCISFISYLISLKWAYKGTIVSTCLYALFACVQFFYLDFFEKVWTLGAIGSLLMAQMIAIFFYQEFIEKLKSMHSHSEEGFQQLVHTEEKYQESENNWKSQWETLVKELEKWKEEAEQRLIEKNQANDLLQNVHQEVRHIENQKHQIVLEVNSARVHAHRLQKENEILKEKLLAVPPIEEKQICLEEFKDQSPEHLASLYKQLRGQFDEKCQILSDTRIDLFKAEGKIHSLQQEKEQELLNATWQEYQFFSQVISQLEQEKEALKQEIQELEKLLSSN